MTTPVQIRDPNVTPTVLITFGTVAVNPPDPAATPTVTVDWGTGLTTVPAAGAAAAIPGSVVGVSVIPPPVTVYPRVETG